MRKQLVKLGFSRQSNRKADEGSKHPDRNAQFEYINAKVVAAKQPPLPLVERRAHHLPSQPNRRCVDHATPRRRSVDIAKLTTTSGSNTLGRNCAVVGVLTTVDDSRVGRYPRVIGKAAQENMGETNASVEEATAEKIKSLLLERHIRGCDAS